MPTRHLLPALALVAVSLILAACGDGDGDDDGPDTIVITSDDGRLTIEIPLDALDDEDLVMSITAVPKEELPEELQVVRGAGTGYRLEPDGLEFSEPVAVSLELDRSELEDEPEDGISAYALVSFRDGGEPELLENLVTEARLGEETVVARGELTHFSWLTKTKGSLTVRMDLLGREQPVGGTFVADAEAQNSDRIGQVTLSGTIGRFFTIGGVVSIQSGETFTGPAVLANGSVTRGVAAFKCDIPGVALYGVRVLALSVLEGQRGGTQLEVVVDRDVECFAPGPTATPGPTETPGPPAATEEPGAQLFEVLQMAGCVHTQPGFRSEVQTWVSVSPLGRFSVGFDAVMLAGTVVEASAQGPGLLQPTASGVTDNLGQAFLAFPIDQFGPYEISIDRIIDPEGAPLEFAPGSQTNATLEVGDVCTPPGQLSADGATCAEPGDADGDGDVDLTDLSLIALFAQGHIDSVPCPVAADVDGDGEITVDDVAAISFSGS